MSVQSVVASVLILVLVAGGYVFVRQLIDEKREDKFYRQIQTNYRRAKRPEQQLQHLQRYLTEYPSGRHAKQIQALVAKVEGQRGVDIRLEFSVAFHGGESVPLSGRVQLLRANKCYDEIKQAMDADEKIAALVEQAERDEKKQLELFDAVGSFLAKIKAEVAAQAPLEKGRAHFPELAPGEYLVYGAGSAGANLIGFFDKIDVQEEGAIELAPTYYSAHERNPGRRLDKWQPEGVRNEQEEG